MEENARLQTLFEALDLNKDGKIDGEELAAGLHNNAPQVARPTLPPALPGPWGQPGGGGNPVRSGERPLITFAILSEGN